MPPCSSQDIDRLADPESRQRTPSSAHGGEPHRRARDVELAYRDPGQAEAEHHMVVDDGPAMSVVIVQVPGCVT